MQAVQQKQRVRAIFAIFITGQPGKVSHNTFMKKKYARLFRNMDRKIRWLFVFSLVAFTCFMGILYQQKAVQEKARLQIYVSYGAIKKLEKINALVLETESVSRGYLLTKDPDRNQHWRISTSC
jgi:hypothetical protein